MPVGALVLYSNYTFNGALVYWWYKLRASSGSAVHLYAYRVYHAYETCVVGNPYLHDRRANKTCTTRRRFENHTSRNPF